MNKGKDIRIYFASLLFIIACNNQPENFKAKNSSTEKDYKVEDSLYSLRLLKSGDSLMGKMPKTEYKVYAQTAKGIIKVVNENWPESIESTFNLIERSSKPSIYIEVPYSESGDWNNTYTYYFDEDGNTRVIKTISSFFNSECVSGALTEETTYLYDRNFKVLSKKYNLQDEHGKIIKDTSKCIFNYRFNVPIYSKYSETPLGLNFHGNKL